MWNPLLAMEISFDWMEHLREAAQSPSQGVLMAIALTTILGVIGQVLASLTRMPAIVFLLLLGMLAGESVLGWIQPHQSLGQVGLSTLTSAFVAIILFEGGLTLKPEILRDALIAVRRLVTIGAALCLIGTAVLAHWCLAKPYNSWSYAFLFASLIVVTGPTVISPILRRVRLSSRLHAVLKSESILIDPVGAIIAIVVLQYVLNLIAAEATLWEAIIGFVGRLSVGAACGALFAYLGVYLARAELLRHHENEHLVNLGALGLAFGAFALSEVLVHESGVMAVTVAGLILGARPLPFREELEKFKEHLTTLGVSVLFILLAATVDLKVYLTFGWREVLLLLGIMFVVRPITVFLCTIDTPLNWREKTYLGLIAPRGILAAAMAAYFAHHLETYGISEGRRIESLVFLTIAVTVVSQGSAAGPLARWLGVLAGKPTGMLVVGVNRWSLALAEVLRDQQIEVRFLDRNAFKCDSARERGFWVQNVDATDLRTYEEIDFAPIGTLIAMTPNDAVNTLVCEEVQDWLGRERVYQVVSKPINDATRSRVKTRGRWAMPSKFAHQTVCNMIEKQQLVLANYSVSKEFVLNPEMTWKDGTFIPMVVIGPRGARLAIAGETCPTGSVIVGLTDASVTEPEEAQAESTVTADPAVGT